MKLPTPSFTRSLIVSTFLGLTCLSVSAEEAISLTFQEGANSPPVSDVLVLVPSGQPPAPENARMVQENRQFHPRVLVVPKGSEVNFPNQDNTQHHVYSFSPAKTFELELFADTPKEPVRFDQAGIVELGCNIHDQMQAFILVTDGQTVLRSNEEGRLTVPPSLASRALESGAVSIWHPRMRDNDGFRTVTFEMPPADTVSIDLELMPEEDAGEFDDLQQRYQDL